VTTADRSVRLGYGYNPGLPANVPVAWGARAITTDTGGIDLVHDRQSAFGPRHRVRNLTRALDAGVNDRWMSAASALLGAGIMSPGAAAEFVLTRTDGVIVKGNTLGSGGYLYVCAYPETPERGTVAWARAEVDRLQVEHGTLITGAGFAAMEDAIRQITRPAFAVDELVLAERAGNQVWIGRFLGEGTNSDGTPNGIGRVALHPRAGEKAGSDDVVGVGLIRLAPASPLAPANQVQEAQQ